MKVRSLIYGKWYLIQHNKVNHVAIELASKLKICNSRLKEQCHQVMRSDTLASAQGIFDF